MIVRKSCNVPQLFFSTFQLQKSKESTCLLVSDYQFLLYLESRMGMVGEKERKPVISNVTLDC